MVTSKIISIRINNCILKKIESRVSEQMLHTGFIAALFTIPQAEAPGVFVDGWAEKLTWPHT